MEINSFFFGFFVIVLVNSENTNIENTQDDMKKIFNRNFLEDIKHLSKLKDNGARDIISEISSDNQKNHDTYPKEKGGMDQSDIITDLDRISKEVIKQSNVKVNHSNKTDAYHEVKTETDRKISSGTVRDDVKNSDRGVNKNTTTADNIDTDREVKSVQEETKEAKSEDNIENVPVKTSEKDLKVKPKTGQKENKKTRLEKNTDSDREDNKEQDRQEENRNTGFKESEDIHNEEIIKETGRGNAKDTDQKNTEDMGREGIKDTGRETPEETNQKDIEQIHDDGKNDLSREESEYLDDVMYKKVKFRNKTDNSHTTKHNLPLRIHDTKGKFAENNDQKMKNKDNILNTDNKKDIQNQFEKDTLKTESHAYKPIKDKLTHYKEINENLKHKEETLDITFKPKIDDVEFRGSDKGKLHDKKEKTSKDKEEGEVEVEISTIRDEMEEEKNVPKKSIKANTVIEEKTSSTSGKRLTRLSSISDRITTLASSKSNLTKVNEGVPKDNNGIFTIDYHRTNNDEFDNLTTLPKPRSVAKESVLHKVTSNLLPSQNVLSAKSKITHDVEVSKTPKRKNVVLSWTTDSVQTRTESRSLEQNLFSSTTVEKKKSITKTKIMDIAGMSKKRYPTETTRPSANSSTNRKISSKNPSVLSFENKETSIETSNSDSISNSKVSDNQMSAAGNFKKTESQRTLKELPKTDFENNYAEKSSSGPCQAGLDPSVQYTGSALVAAAVGGVFIGAFAVLILLHLIQKCRKYVNGDYRRVPMEYDFELNPRFKNN